MGIGGGVETMSNGNMMDAVNPNLLSEQVFEHELASNCMMPMGITSENVAAEFGIDRKAQDTLAYESHQKAANSHKQGWTKKEVTPYTSYVKDKDGNQKEILVDMDDGARPGTTMESLGKLKAAFQKGGSTTAGNSSQMTDGAAAILLTRRDVANKLGCKIYGRVLSYAVAGVPPKIMGIGPAYAIPAALEKAGCGLNDMDVFEINEAFASQATYCVEKLKVPREKLNPRGGAIACGHPLGMTGARMIVTLFHELERTNKKRGLVSMCIGTGMGACGVFERAHAAMLKERQAVASWLVDNGLVEGGYNSASGPPLALDYAPAVISLKAHTTSGLLALRQLSLVDLSTHAALAKLEPARRDALAAVLSAQIRQLTAHDEL